MYRGESIASQPTPQQVVDKNERRILDDERSDKCLLLLCYWVVRTHQE